MAPFLCLPLLLFIYCINGLYYHPLKIKDALLSNCTKYFIEQPLDHFNYATGSTPNNIQTYKQRYFICGGSNWKQNNTIFFYHGNEANVELYVNNTGLMWENADSFNAIMIFAEHRYYGESMPFTQAQLDKDVSLYRFVSPEQAMADYAQLIYYIKTQQFGVNTWSSPIIGFGGSYGGFLCAWFSIKYPQWIDGCISGSAAILDFEGEIPLIDPKFYAQTMTFATSTAGGGNDLCVSNIRKTWPIIFNLTKTVQGRQQLTSIFNLCSELENENIAQSVAFWQADSVSFMSMGSFPFASSYMTNGDGILPPYPLRYACDTYMAKNFSDDNYEILHALRDFSGVFYNVTNKTCYDINDDLGPFIPGKVAANPWNYISCTNTFMRGTHNDLYTTDGINDMFWNNTWNITELSDACYNSLGVRPRVDNTAIQYGGSLLKNDGVKNIVFSNGLLDPWCNGGIHFNNTENGIYSILRIQILNIYKF